ncbi:MAG: FAD-binding oxidoreductase [Pseudomonadota bacterium]
MAEEHFDVAVIGAGMVGVCCASWIQRTGKRVAVLDRNPAGTGTSYGNAGTIAPFGIAPINHPNLVRSLPQLLFSKSSALTVDWGYALTHLPWMLSFLRNCRQERVDHISNAMGTLQEHSDAGLNPLIKEASADDLIASIGALYCYSTEAAYEKSAYARQMREKYGVRFETLSGGEILEMEPELNKTFHKGYHFLDSRHVRDSKALTERLFRHFLSQGGSWRQKEVERVSPGTDKVTITTRGGEKLTCNMLVVAAGAHSKSIKGSGAERLPLDTERGYHVVYRGQQDRISRVVGWQEGGFNATPMNGGLRFAGTVEIAGLKKPLNPARIGFLKGMAREMFDGLGEPQEEWLGFRPTLPDSLPVISRSPASDRILLAFGHHHLGLTLSGITGRIIADFTAGRMPNFDVSGFDARRF